MLDFQKDIVILHVFLSISMPQGPVNVGLSMNLMRNDAAETCFVTKTRKILEGGYEDVDEFKLCI